MSERTNRISPEAEQRLIDSVQQAIGLTNAGGDPSEAVAKVASDRGYNTDFTARMVEMYNTSRTLAHFKQASAEERAADFPLADLAKVAELLAGPDSGEAPAGEVIAKAANFMEIRPPMAKAAAAAPATRSGYGRYGLPIVGRAANGELNMRRKVAEARTALSAAQDERTDMLRKLAAYFRQPGSMRFEEFETRVIGMHKRAGALLSSAVWDYLGSWQQREKRGSAPERPLLTDFRTRPFDLLEPIFRATEKVAELRRELAEVEQATVDYRKTLHEKMAELQALQKGAVETVPEANRNKGVPMYIEAEDEDNPTEPVDDDAEPNAEERAELTDSRELELQDSGEKEAHISPFVLSSETLGKEATSPLDLARWEAGRSMLQSIPLLAGEEKPDPTAKLLETATTGIDPVHEAELNAIEAEGVLQDMLATDPVISTYDPDEVLDAYNEVARFAPQSVRQPLVLRGYLRKYLESSSSPTGKVMEGFDVKQLQDLEKGRAEVETQAQKDLETLQAQSVKPQAGKL